MYPTILVPLEDSAQSRRVVAYAARLAAIGGGRLILMQAITDPELRNHAEDTLSHIAADLASHLRSVETMVKQGDPGKQIIAAAAETGVDLIAMATNRWTNLDRWLNGSVVDWTLRHTLVPLFVIPPNCAGEWPDEQTPGILVPLDGSPLAEEALEPALALARLLNSGVVLMRAVDASSQIAATHAYLDELRARKVVADARIGIRNHVVMGDAISAIVDAQSDPQIGIIAMATHGRTGMEQLLAGSVATSVLQHARMPVLLVRPIALRAASVAPTQASLERLPFLITG